MPRARGRSTGLWLCLLLSLLTSLQALAQVATVYTDRADYLPGDIVVIEGNGWQAGEAVRLEIDHSTVSHGNTVLTATADPNGHIYNDQFVIQPIHLGESFTLVATGQSSGLTARTAFTDGNIQSVAVSAASAAATYGTSAQIDYTVIITKTGGGADITASLSLAGQPAGATYTFTPGSVVLGNGSNATKTVTLRITTNTAKVNAGGAAYSFTVRATNADASVDYKEGNGQLIINRRATTATLTGTVTKTYDGTAAATLAPANYNLSAVLASDAVSIGTTAGLYANAAAGTGKLVSVTGLTLSGADAGNYALSSSAASGPVGVISARPVTGSFTAAGKTYDGGTGASVLTRSLTGTVAGDDISLTGGTATFATKQAGPTKSVTLSGATLGGTKAGNYTLSSVAPATAAIDARPLTISATGVSRPYDGTTAASVTLQDNRVTNDVLVPAYAAATFPTPDAGADRPVSVSGITLGGSDAPNYTFNTAASTTATISRRPLTVTADPQSKTYGDPDPALTYQAPDLISGDVLSGALSRASGENAGSSYLIQQGTLANANYSISFTAAGFTITARAVAITPTAGQSKTYGDPDPAFTFANDGALPPAAFSGALGRAPGATVAGGPYAYTLGTLSAGSNYALQLVTGNSFAIARRHLALLATVHDKEYDGTTAASLSGALLNGVVGQDDVQLQSATATFATKSVGDGIPVTLSGFSLVGNSASNYLLTQIADISGSITPRALLVTATAADKPYDGTAAATATLHDDRVSGDVLTTSYATATFADANVGAGKAVSVGGIAVSGPDAGNYVANSATGTTATISPRPLAVTAEAQTKSYGAADPALTYLAPGLLGGDALSGALTRTAGEDVGAYAIGLGTLANANYSITFSPANLTVTSRLVAITPTAGQHKTYGDADPAFTFANDAALPAAAFTGALSRTAGATVTGSPYAYTLGTLSAGPNYSLGLAGSSAFAIQPRPLTATVTVANKAYDGTTAASISAASLSNVVASDDVQLQGATAAFADKAAAYGKSVAISGASLGGSAAPNYALLPVAPATADITARALAVTATAADKTYDATPAAAVTLHDDRVPGDALALSHAPATFADAHAGTGKLVSVGGIAVGGADASNYTHNLSTTAAASIAPRPLTVTADAQSKTYGDADPTLTYQAPGLLGSDVLGGSLSRLPGESVGSYSILQGSLSNADYALSYVGASLGIGVRTVVISPLPGQSKIYGSADPALAYAPVVLVGTDALSGALARTGGETVPGSPYAYTLGTLTAGSNYYLQLASVPGFAISARELTPFFTAASKTYDATTAATITSRSLSGAVPGDDVQLSGGAATFDSPSVGTAKLVTAGSLGLGGSAAANYALTSATATTSADITAVTLTPHITANDKEYDGNTTATLASQSVTGMVAGETAVSLVVGSQGFDDARVGARTVTASGLSLGGAQASNYRLPTGATASAPASITAKSLTAVVGVDDKDYDGTTAAHISGRALMGVVGTDAVQLTGNAATFADKHAGTGKTATATGLGLTGADAGNYSLPVTTATATARIRPRALVVTATAADKPYDGTAAATATLHDDRVSGDVLTTSYATATFADANVGQNKPISVSGIAVSGADAGNYLANATTGTSANITARGLTVTADAQTKVYGGAEPALTYQASGLLSGEVLSGSLSRAVGENVGSYAIGQGSLTNANYSISFVGATLSITPKAITGTFAADNKVYDGNPSAAIGSRALVDVLPADLNRISLSGGTATFADKNAGLGKTVTGTGFALAGPAAGNYSLTSVASALAGITPKPITGDIAAADKVYDGNTTAQLTDRTLNGVVGSDAVSLTGGTASFANKLVGAGKTVTATGLALSGADAGNYALGSISATQASITAKSLTGNITALSKVYDGTPAATIDTRTLTGVVPGDAVQLTGGAAAFADKHVGAGKPVTATGLGLGGNDAGNYSLPVTTATTTASITAKSLLIDITASDKVYDRTRTAAVAARISSGLVDGDVVNVGATDGQFDTKDAGASKVVTANVNKTGADAGNYSANSTATARAAITPKPLTATITANGKVYDGTTAATLSAVAITLPTDIISPDAVTVAAANPAFNLPTVGSRTVTAGITLGGADAGNYQLTAPTASAPATITERAVVVTATANQGKVYGASEPPLTYGISSGSLAPGDAFSGQLGRAPGSNAGTYAIQLGSLALNANYTLTLTPGALFVIAPKSLTPAIAASNKTYDGTTAASVTPQALVGLVGNDAVSLLANGSNTFASKTAGAGKTVTAAGLTLGGAQAGNYALSSTTATATADILPKTLTGFVTAADKVYDGYATASISSRTLTGVVPGDAVQLTGGTAAFADKHVGTNKPVTATGLGLSGNDVSNYSLATSPITTTASITAKAAVVTPTANGKEYGAPEPTLAGTLTGFVGLDNITATYSRTPGENVGGSPYTISATLSPVAALSNYSITYNTAPFTIGQAELTVTANSVATQYSQPKPTFGVSFAGFRNGDNAGVVSGAAAFACPAAFSSATPATVNSPAGTYSITPSLGTLSAPNYRFRFVAGTLTVTEETGLVSYTGQTYFATASPTSSTASLLLSAQAQDDPDGSRGDIVNNAVVDFRTDVNTMAAPFLNQVINLNRPIGYISAGVGTEGLATSATLSYTLSGSEVNQSGTTLVVAPVLNAKNGRYYTGAATQPTTITITIPGQDNVSGGGFVVPLNSLGTYASAPGSKVNFGFTMKYNNSGRNLQGQANIIVRSGGVNYQFKSNAINSLTLSDYKPGVTVVGKKAVFNTKANLTNLSTGASLGGNLDLTVEVVQATVVGGKDMVSIRVSDAGSNLLYANNWTGGRAELQPLDGGKISVRSSTAAREVAGPNTSTQVAPDAATATVAAVRTAQLTGRPTLSAAPNPFAERALIEVDFSADDAYRLDLYDVRGALLKHLQAGTARAGAHVAVPCDNTGLPVGLYLVRLTTKYGVQHLRLIRE